MTLKGIEIDVEVHKAIENLRKSFGQTPNDILREVFHLKALATQDKDIQAKPAEIWTTKNVPFTVGSKLKTIYKGQEYFAEVLSIGLLFDGKIYQSPSAAAIAVTGTNVNGWRFWMHYDEQRYTWVPIDTLRS